LLKDRKIHGCFFCQKVSHFLLWFSWLLYFLLKFIKEYNVGYFFLFRFFFLNDSLFDFFESFYFFIPLFLNRVIIKSVEVLFRFKVYNINIFLIIIRRVITALFL
jgi:hypothetical protein